MITSTASAGTRTEFSQDAKEVACLAVPCLVHCDLSVRSLKCSFQSSSIGLLHSGACLGLLQRLRQLLPHAGGREKQHSASQLVGIHAQRKLLES